MWEAGEGRGKEAGNLKKMREIFKNKTSTNLAVGGGRWREEKGEREGGEGEKGRGTGRRQVWFLPGLGCGSELAWFKTHFLTKHPEGKRGVVVTLED